MSRVVVTENALRQLVREALWNKEFAGWSANHDGPATVNADVDPSIAVTDPVNPNFTPQSKTEFGIAVNQLVKNLPDDQMPGLYDTVKTAIDQKNEKEDEEEMVAKAAAGGTTQVEEEAVRRVIRNMLSELNPRWGQVSEAGPPPMPSSNWMGAPKKKSKEPEAKSFSGELPPVKKIPINTHGGEAQRRIDKNVGDLHKGLGKAVAAYEAPPTDADLGVDEPNLPDDAVDDIEAADAAAPKRRGAYKSTALGAMGEEGASFQDIAVELSKDLKAEADEELAAAEAAGDETRATAAKGMKTTAAVSGAKRIVDQAIEKWKFIDGLPEEDLEILTLTALNTYAKKMEKSPDPKDMKQLARELYIDDLNSTGELTPADVQLMQDHPSVVHDLEGFKEYEADFMKDPLGYIKMTANLGMVEKLPGFRETLHNVIMKARRPGQKLVNPVKDDDDAAPPQSQQTEGVILYLKKR